MKVFILHSYFSYAAVCKSKEYIIKLVNSKNKIFITMCLKCYLINLMSVSCICPVVDY